MSRGPYKRATERRTPRPEVTHGLALDIPALVRLAEQRLQPVRLPRRSACPDKDLRGERLASRVQ